MTHLGSYYSLCPLIDSKNLMGITEDREKDIVIVTLGRNVACRYKLSDQRQISSWKTKEKFSSPVFYDTTFGVYIAVFNSSYIKWWNVKEDNLDKIKKLKFQSKIYSLISDNGITYILFENGSIYTLSKALDMRKDLNPKRVISETEQIECILYKRLNGNFYVGLIVRSSTDELNLYWTKCVFETYLFSKLKLVRDGVTLKGCVFHTKEKSVSLLTLWADGRIISYPLHTDGTDEAQELVILVDSVSTKYTVSIASLDENYIAMFGANPNEEGAILIIYNILFNITQSTQPFKLFTDDAKLWCIENNLLLPVGHNLAVIPFVLEMEQLASLTGSHKILQAENNTDISVVQELEVASWNVKCHLKGTETPQELLFETNELLKQGLPENIIMSKILPKLFKQKNTRSLLSCINYFSDIPERYLAKLLKYILTLEELFFINNEYPSRLHPTATIELINTILCKSFNETWFLPHLRSELSINDLLLLIKYISFLWSDDGNILPSLNVTKTEAKLISWCCVVIDSNYQKFLLSKDQSVRKILTELLQLTEKLLYCYSELNSIVKLLSNKRMKYKDNVTLKYSIEQINWY